MTELKSIDTPSVEIRHRHSGAILQVVKGAYLRGAYLRDAYLRDAYLVGADLSGADLRGAFLSGADLRGAFLEGADLEGAFLEGADLYSADLYGAGLRDADLRGADLRGADLRGAGLRGADLRDADLRDADLRGAKVNWQSHDLLAEILRCAAQSEIAYDPAGLYAEKIKAAGLILVQRNWCWDEFLALDDPLQGWAVNALAEYVTDGENAPPVIRAAAEAKKAAALVGGAA